MQVVSGIVIDGKVVVEGLSLPEGMVVTVLARGDEAVVKLSPEEEADLLAALDEAERKAFRLRSFLRGFAVLAELDA